MPTLHAAVAQIKANQLDLMQKIWTKVKTEDKEDEIIERLMRLANMSTGSSACSLLLYDEHKQELYFKYAEGRSGQPIKRLNIARQSGITSWILKSGKPMMVNNAEKNANYHKLIDNATGFKTRAIIGVPISIDKKVIGVIEVLNKSDNTSFTQQDVNMVTDLSASAAATIQSIRMNAELIRSFKGTVKALVSLADAKETVGDGHSRRVAEYALLCAGELALSKEEKQNIEYAGILHDIGKLSIADEILNKTSKLTDKDWEIIRKHPVIGYNLLKDIPFLREASRYILYHHERYDGGGYPQGLQGKRIPLGARLISVADAFDFMTTDHAHRKALDYHQAFKELADNANSQFCPAAVKAFNDGFVRTRLSKIKGTYIPKSNDFLTVPPAVEKVPKSPRPTEPVFQLREATDQLSKSPRV
jgi:HD-GYP domain-containing protein (c-di-GMP phosphodiesterase class II)